MASAQSLIIHGVSESAPHSAPLKSRRHIELRKIDNILFWKQVVLALISFRRTDTDGTGAKKPRCGGPQIRRQHSQGKPAVEAAGVFTADGYAGYLPGFVLCDESNSIATAYEMPVHRRQHRLVRDRVK